MGFLKPELLIRPPLVVGVDPLVPLGNGWTTPPTGRASLSIILTQDGIVWFNGALNGVSATGSPFTLPPGYRPAGQVRFFGRTTDAVGNFRVEIDTDGVVAVGPTFTVDPVSFDAVHFAVADASRFRREAPHIVGTPGEPTFNTNWVPSSGLLAPQFFKTPDGIVYLGGSAENAVDSSPSTIFTLPPGYRPSAEIAQIGRTAIFNIIVGKVLPDGSVQAFTGSVSDRYSIDRLVFRADQ